MRLLITGANGFLGRKTVEAALHAGHRVRALVRPASSTDSLPANSNLEVVRVDLRTAHELPAILSEIDAVIHLAAGVVGADMDRFVATVVTTENLLKAVKLSKIQKFVHISSFSVYNFGEARKVLTEDSPVLDQSSGLYSRDGYAIAKVWQERIIREAHAVGDWDLCVIRPGFIWGKGNLDLAGLGFAVGPIFFRVSGGKHLPLTYVENAATAIIKAAERKESGGTTLNLIDSPGESGRAYLTAQRRAASAPQFIIPLPYFIGISAARLAKFGSWLFFGKDGKLPGILIASRFEARFKPLRFPNDRIRQTLNWAPAVTFEAALRKAFREETNDGLS
ncbi:3 beta-hydroxysteroid dehydrogenase/Delta 5--_4-isomerase [Roseimaritima multifibrata]|uniref:3 beta-hydroxysteroid dehydrogenase/Delta 5-->4-isomerase n=1 Tax=Roseimaritima multifibrata TaxID=1930274 RepID=A0A517MMH5_9BACT|nr:NAD(P)-dependent oxidoreductase [Roseimaritima multifibrata]QDS96083.1 3 beta-hydroxysteroid dehydrogenase/Delta 5-->4-isomerase [Roseimaritima multifibrata]